VLRQERIEAIDILRGLAILGILIVNMGLFSLPEGTAVDGTAQRLIYFFAQEKFKALFSFLFGLGLAVQLMRADARGVRFLPLYARRLCVLFLIGVAHFLFLWDGDILHDYAENGFVLLLFRRLSPKTLLVSAGALLAVPLFFFGLTTYSSITHRVSGPLKSWISYETEPDDQQTIDENRRIYSSGTYGEQIGLRAGELPGDVTPDIDDAFVARGLPARAVRWTTPNLSRCPRPSPVHPAPATLGVDHRRSGKRGVCARRIVRSFAHVGHAERGKAVLGRCSAGPDAPLRLDHHSRDAT